MQAERGGRPRPNRRVELLGVASGAIAGAFGGGFELAAFGALAGVFAGKFVTSVRRTFAR